MIGVIADDFTGATDIAGLLARTGADVRLHAGMPSAADGAAGPASAQAQVIALKCRTIPPGEAVSQTRDALDWLRARGADQIYWKYCSTFDSTPRGNIGPVAEALMAGLGVGQTVFCPAFPENGRTVYMGHLFVGESLLSDSPMRHHPLTPMTDSLLTRLLAPQVGGTPGLLPLSVVREGPPGIRRRMAELEARGVAHVVADAVADADLAALGAAFADHPFLTGGSAFAAAAYARRLEAARATAPLPHVPAGPAVFLSGSCSAATREQVARARALGGPVLEVVPEGLDTAAEAALAARVAAALGPAPLLVTSTVGPEALATTQAALGREAAGARVERAMAAAARAARAAGATRIVVAGGETAGAVTLALGAGSLRVGPEIAPGVPWCFAQDAAGPYALALKSGNFGGPDFFSDALQELEEASSCTS